MHVIVHIGPFKTGTSAIQSALTQACAGLRACGILYYTTQPKPARSLSTLYAARKSLRHPELRQYFPTPEEALAWSTACWSDFEAQADAPDLQRVVISSEFFSALRNTEGFLARLKRRFSRITVVAYVRDPVELYLSTVQQNIRGGETLRDLWTPLDYVYPYRKFLPTFAEAVGMKNMIVRRFSREALEGGDVVTDFAARLAEFGAVPDIAPVRANDALPGAVLAWLLLANETWDRKILGAARRETLRRLLADPGIATLPKLRLENRLFEQALRARTRDDCLWLNETFLQGQPPLPVADMAAPEADAARLRADMRDWLVGYLTPEAQHCIARVVTA